MSVYKYRIYCNDESTYNYVWNTTPPTTCPNNNTHVIDNTTITVVDSISNDEQKLNVDIFERLKVVNATTVYSNHNAFGAKSICHDNRTDGGGTVSIDISNSCKLLTVNNIGDRAVSQSRQYFTYIPGYSKFIYISGVFQTTLTPGIRTRIGVFDNHYDKTVDSKGNGHYYEYYNGGMFVVERSSTNGTDQTDVRVAQNDWNTDRMDGTGKSKLSIDPSKGLLMLIEYAWLGVGITRMGFLIGGRVYWAHIWDHSHLQCPYILYAKLPIRYEIQNISAANTTATSRAICQSVQLESSNISSVSHGTSVTFCEDTERIASKATWLPIFSLRTSVAGTRRTIAITKLTIITDIRAIKWRLILNPVLIGPNWRPVLLHPDSAAEYDTTSPIVWQDSNNVQAGFPFESGVIAPNCSETYTFGAPYEVTLNANIAGISDIITLQARGVSNTATFSYSIDWIELY